MTYREKIQEMISRIDAIYEECEPMRDIASEDEKQYWNAMRKTFYDAAQPLRKLDNRLTQSRATMIID
jgi:hypothetical protein